jgi:uncharacterized protein DUF5989
MATTDQQHKDFAAESQAARTGFVKEFLQFLAHNKKWWLLPIVVILLLLVALAIFGSSAAAPFIYTLF